MKSAAPFICQSCGFAHSKWAGQCTECGEWNTLVEEVSEKKKTKSHKSSTKPESILAVQMDPVKRLPSTITELNTTLGGGLVPGSVVLLGGEPGIGKSTLLLQAAADYARNDKKVLYVSGEESTAQIALRAERLQLREKSLLVLAETNLETIESTVSREKPYVLVLDSIQTLQSDEVGSQPGTVSQLRECTHRIVGMAKSQNIPVFIVGHVTKEGSIAGPKILEHMVDVVLYFEGSSTHSFRLLRTIKNRFGSTNEVGVFEMVSKGIRSVDNPSQLFLSERQNSVSGTAIAACVEGSRPILVEVQALVSRSSLAMPRRTAIGVDPNRVSLLVAILEKRAGYRIFDQDVYVNIAGGIRLSEPATDLAIMAALVSSIQGKPLEGQSVFFGEVGLGGECRSVPRTDIRLKEAIKIGMKRAFVPPSAQKEHGKEFSDIELIPVQHIGVLSDFL